MIWQLGPLLLEGAVSNVLESQQAVRQSDPLRLNEQLAGLLLGLLIAEAVERSLQAGRARVDRQQMPISHKQAPVEATALPAGNLAPGTTRTGARSRRYGERGRGLCPCPCRPGSPRPASDPLRGAGSFSRS